jgi:hypothetical protein
LKQKGRFLACQSDHNLISEYFCFYSSTETIPESKIFLLHAILSAEYGENIFSEIMWPFLSPNKHHNMSRQNARAEQKLEDHKLAMDVTAQIQDVIFDRLHDYMEGTKWTLPPPCAVCSSRYMECKHLP